MPRVFIYEGREIPDPNPKLTPDEVRQHLSTFFPELANAEVISGGTGEKQVYELKKRTGTKG